jgi:hypothetical protein
LRAQPGAPPSRLARVDVRQPGMDGFTRDAMHWPLVVARVEPTPMTVH